MQQHAHTYCHHTLSEIGRRVAEVTGAKFAHRELIPTETLMRLCRTIGPKDQPTCGVKRLLFATLLDTSLRKATGFQQLYQHATNKSCRSDLLCAMSPIIVCTNRVAVTARSNDLLQPSV